MKLKEEVKKQLITCMYQLMSSNNNKKVVIEVKGNTMQKEAKFVTIDDLVGSENIMKRDTTGVLRISLGNLTYRLYTLLISSNKLSKSEIEANKEVYFKDIEHYINTDLFENRDNSTIHGLNAFPSVEENEAVNKLLGLKPRNKIVNYKELPTYGSLDNFKAFKYNKDNLNEITRVTYVNYGNTTQDDYINVIIQLDNSSTIYVLDNHTYGLNIRKYVPRQENIRLNIRDLMVHVAYGVIIIPEDIYVCASVIKLVENEHELMDYYSNKQTPDTRVYVKNGLEILHKDIKEAHKKGYLAEYTIPDTDKKIKDRIKYMVDGYDYDPFLMSREVILQQIIEELRNERFISLNNRSKSEEAFEKELNVLIKDLFRIDIFGYLEY